MGDTETALFQGQTAWFSASVLKRRIKLWKKHGGLIAGIDHAQFVFSEDEEAADTKQIFCSEAYIDEHLAVFHAMYVSDSAKQKNGTKLPLGDYFLPPKEVQQLIKKQKKFKWEDVNDSGEDNTSSSSEEEEGTANHAGQAAEDYVDIQVLAKITGPIVDFVPGKHGCEVSSKNKSKT
ncbi:telomere repeats-binding bouquet formation protein 2-like isoform X2 [Pecten maximus]|uniref:telomere repeats-binding bouquet formation protein 2-like isoform X2 n=1 Tax=Pecten maximus TaxID=6579 RepID=UPI00145895C2|nr:telomere repeats-binding bouquet formation protein 2-like isoform X2 [Pecten maximus]